MRQEQLISRTDLDERTRQAVDELQATIVASFPTTTFELTHDPENPASLHLLAVADVDDPDEVGDLVVEQVVALQVDEGIPLHVIPLRTPERVQSEAAERRHTSQLPVRGAWLWGEGT